MARVVIDEGGFAAVKARVARWGDRVALDVGTDAEARAPKRTGALAISVAVDKTGDTHWEISAWGGDRGRHYAAYVELGTRYMTARPFLKPACYSAR